MKNSLRNLSLLAAMLMAGTSSSWAQFKAETTTGAIEGYARTNISFNALEVAEKLGCADTTALFNLIDQEGGGAVYIKTADGRSSTYTGNPNEFWMNADGTVQNYGDTGTCWWAGLYANRSVEEGQERTVDVGFGQMPGWFKKVYTDTDLACTLYLVNGGQEISFDVTWHITASPEPAAMERYLSKLNIVKEYTQTLTYKEGTSYGDIADSLQIDGFFDALGLDKSTFDGSTANITDNFLVQSAVQDSSSSYVFTDSLVNLNALDGWVGRYSGYDEDNDKEFTYEQNAAHAWGANATVYFHTPTITQNAAGEDVLAFVTGPYPDTMKPGDKDYVELYYVVGDKAVKFTYNFVIKEKENVDPSEYVKVGTQTVVIERDKTAASDYSQENFTVDTAPIVEALGCDYADMDVMAWEMYDAETGEYSNMSANYTQAAATKGFFFGPDGTVQNWGDASAFYVGISDFAAGTFYNGFMAGHYAGITADTTDVAHMLFVNGKNYYDLVINFTVKNIKKDSVSTDEWHVVATYPYDVQLIKSEGYEQAADSKTQLPLESILSALGASKIDASMLYTWKKSDNYNTLIPDSLTNTYNMNPAPGFWMSEDGKYSSGWSSSCAYGMALEAATGIVTWYVHPDTGNEPGAAFKGDFFLVNVENGNVVKLVFNISYVETRQAITVEGESNMSIALTDDNINADGLYTYAFDLTDALKALGFDSVDELATASWYVQNELGTFSALNGTDFEGENVGFDANGNYTENDDDKVFFIGYDTENNQFTVSILGAEVTEDLLYETRIALRNDDAAKQYIFNISLGSQKAVGIKEVVNNGKAVNGKVYDLNGRLLKGLQRGLNIVGGKKVLVK